ncbi:(NiFe)-hydrogenase-3-type complex Eha, EhaM [Methanocaldococcus infernus ME]|uniref:(NiFe)-hydrogenase-3-type complex Eha, EhaM n=1 Tax=Methanocaldococcus infernus (strain DSM 11812 / JCM 15783 / ME) TaxID=573063 RepID=D5VTP4_METIM|nr:DUF1959 family protein [Methanocaldococcus infernus]ADG13947.1 (NiFe)-hydrogenase-3-type complex Eha, EhaM [Methanocaldococcus infernus ME]
MIEELDKKYEELSKKQKRNIFLNRYLIEDALIPMAKKLGIELEELIDIILEKYDFCSCYEIHAYAEQAKMGCLGRKVDIDLGLCWLSDFFSLIDRKEADKIRKLVVEKTVLYKVPYKDSLKEGREKVIKALRGKE